jgi:Tfp pilus assembly protein PilO
MRNWKNKTMKITPREKKLIFFGASVVAAVMIFYLITLLLPDRESRAQQVETKKALLLRYRQMLSQEEIYQKQVEQYSAQLEQDMTRLLPGDNPNVAEADMQKLLKSFADQSGLEITRINTLPDEKIEDDLIKVSVSIEVNSDLAQLVRFLTEIQNHEKFLKIEQFQITGIQTQRRQQIRPSLTVVGYIRSKEPEANKAPPESGEATDEPPAAVVEDPGD